MLLAGLTFHHFGLGTKKPNQASLFLQAQGYSIGETVFDPLQNVNLSLCCSPNAPAVEIISPADGPSPLDGILNKYNAGIYHLCYESEDIEKSLSILNEFGLNVIPAVAEKEAVLFGGAKVSFYIVVNVGLIEIIER